jgi:POB3-like N-terminal PH domain
MLMWRMAGERYIDFDRPSQIFKGLAAKHGWRDTDKSTRSLPYFVESGHSYFDSNDHQSMSLGVWKHIGLHGHSVGSFACEEGGIKWTSALTHGSVQGFTKSIPKDAITAAQWTPFGKSGYIRVKTNGDKKLHHEIRFDGFPVNEFDQLRDIFKDHFKVELTKYSINAAGTQYGLAKMSGKKLTFHHCILEDAEEEGEVRPALLAL